MLEKWVSKQVANVYDKDCTMNFDVLDIPEYNCYAFCPEPRLHLKDCITDLIQTKFSLAAY